MPQLLEPRHSLPGGRPLGNTPPRRSLLVRLSSENTSDQITFRTSIKAPSQQRARRASLNRRFAERLLAYEISRYPEVARRGLVPMEA